MIKETHEIEKLLEQIEIFQTAFESSFDGIHILNWDGETIYINKACERIEGITFEEASKLNIREMVAQGVYSESVTLKVLKTKATATIIQKVKNGNIVLATGTPIVKNGVIDKIVVNSRDVTELNLLRQALSEKENMAKIYQEELQLLRMETLKGTDFVVKSQKMKRIEHLAMIMSKVDSTVLLNGESGVGKGVISQYIHNRSSRCDGPFIKIDCSAIPENLFESEVFGYEKGAFTGAERSGKIGLLELANGGTVFLDEIGDMPLHMQPKILRAIQDREIVRVGGKEVIAVNIRFIAATNRDLKQMVENREFREDLYYRLNVVPILIPPLRERKEDIIPLVQDITKKINERYGISKTFNNHDIEGMLNYDWPGNIRELENIIERIMVTEDGDFSLLQSMGGTKNYALDGCGYKEKLDAYDKMIISDTIKTEGSVLKAAEKLGINATTIRRKMKKQNEPAKTSNK